MSDFRFGVFESRVSLCASIFLLILTVGCSGPIGPTAGTVRFEDGSPVQSGRIEFRDLASGDRFVSAIETDGRFHPVDTEGQAGLPPGKYEVVVVQMVLTEDLAAEDHDHGVTVPRRYADYYTSDLKAEVAADQQADIEVTLKSE